MGNDLSMSGLLSKQVGEQTSYLIYSMYNVGCFLGASYNYILCIHRGIVLVLLYYRCSMSLKNTCNQSETEFQLSFFWILLKKIIVEYYKMCWFFIVSRFLCPQTHESN